MSLTSQRGKPFQSKLVPVAGVIVALRKQNISFVEISRILLKQHGISAAPSGIHNFVKVRSKPPRAVYTMIEPALSRSRTPLPVRPISQSDAIEKLKRSKAPFETPKIFTYDENKPLTFKP